MVGGRSLGVSFAYGLLGDCLVATFRRALFKSVYVNFRVMVAEEERLADPVVPILGG